jgi:hypothetical protein
MEISLIDRVRNEVVLFRVKEESSILHKIKQRLADWIGHILHRNCLLKHVIERKTEVMGSERKRKKKTLAATE